MKTILVTALTALLVVPSFSQIRDGKNTELSLSGSFQNISSSQSDDSQTLFLLSPRVGFFVSGGLELEPEVILLIAEGSDASYILNGNVAYNFLSDSGATVPFLLAGYGYANSVPLAGLPLFSFDDGFGVLNLGAGVKHFFGNVAFRAEYRFQNYTGSRESFFGNGSIDVDYTLHTVQFGFSVLL